MAVVEAGTDPLLWDEGAREALVRVLSLVAHPERKVGPTIVASQCSKYCGGRAEEVAAVIESWLEWYRSTGFVRKDAIPTIFALLEAELATQVNDELVWAMGTVDPDEVSRRGELPRPNQPPWAEVADRAMRLIRGIAGSDAVLMPDAFGRGFEVSKEGIVTGGPLRVLEHVEQFSDIIRAVVPSIVNLVRWVVAWRGVAIVDILEEGVHPSVYGLVARELTMRLGDARATQLLSLVRADSTDQAIALAIHETLLVASGLRARGRQVAWGVATSQPSDSAQGEEIFLSGDRILQSLPEALTALDPNRSLRWLARLLCRAERISGSRDRERAADLELLFTTTEKSAASLLADGEPIDGLLAEFMAPLIEDRRLSKIHHLEAIAIRLEESHADKARSVRSCLFEEYERQLSDARITQKPLDGGDDGFRRDDAVASALAREAAADGAAYPVEFLDRIYATLGLSIWDCEEDGTQFHRDLRIAQNLIGVGAMAALYANEIDSVSKIALAEWCATRLWSNDLLVAHLEHSFDQWQNLDVLATVVLAMLRCLPGRDARIASLMSTAEFPSRALSSVAKYATDGQLRHEAVCTLVLRFDAKTSLRPYEAREWANRFLAFGDPERGLRAIDLIPVDGIGLEPYDHGLVVRLILAALEEPESESRWDRGELKSRAQQSYRRARHYLLGEGSDDAIRGQMEALRIAP